MAFTVSELVESLLYAKSLLEVLNVDVPLEKADCLPCNEASSNGGDDNPACSPGKPDEQHGN